MRIIKILVPFFFLAILSCTKEATIELPKSEQKLVVTCFVVPGDTELTASVRLSLPKFGASRFGSSQDQVQNAKVVLSDGTNEVTFKFVDSINCYWAKATTVPIVEGKTYSLNVSTPDGKKVSATTTVPVGKLPIKDLAVNITFEGSNRFEYTVKSTIGDIAGQTNYLAVYSRNHITDTWQGPNFNDFYAFGYFDSDDNAQKTQYVYSAEHARYTEGTIVYFAVEINALNCSRDFYLYHKSVQSAGEGQNPFADPVLIYTNINGGFGCFGSFVMSSELKRIK